MQTAVLIAFFALFSLIVVLIWMGGAPLFASVMAVSFGTALVWAEIVLGA